MQAEKNWCPLENSSALEFQATVLIPATRAADQFRPTSRRIEMLTTYTAECGFLAGMFKHRVIAVIVVEPQAQKYDCDEQAENDCGDDKIHPRDQWLNPGTSANRTGWVRSDIKTVIGTWSFLADTARSWEWRDAGTKKRAEIIFGASKGLNLKRNQALVSPAAGASGVGVASAAGVSTAGAVPPAGFLLLADLRRVFL